MYFADLVTKSANYCHSSKSNPTGVLLLSRVALGKTYDCLQAEYMDNTKPGFDSTKGCGVTIPDPPGALVMYVSPPPSRTLMSPTFKARWFDGSLWPTCAARSHRRLITLQRVHCIRRCAGLPHLRIRIQRTLTIVHSASSVTSWW